MVRPWLLWPDRAVEWMADFYAQRMRRIDLDILWPVCKEESGGRLERARMAFKMHTAIDPSWHRLGEDRINEIVDGLQ
jgi:hypothetical protein